MSHFEQAPSPVARTRIVAAAQSRFAVVVIAAL